MQCLANPEKQTQDTQHHYSLHLPSTKYQSVACLSLLNNRAKMHILTSFSVLNSWESMISMPISRDRHQPAMIEILVHVEPCRLPPNISYYGRRLPLPSTVQTPDVSIAYLRCQVMVQDIGDFEISQHQHPFPSHASMASIGVVSGHLEFVDYPSQTYISASPGTGSILRLGLKQSVPEIQQDGCVRSSQLPLANS